MRGTQIGNRSQIFESQHFMQMGMHGLDRALNGLRLSVKGLVTRCALTENGCCCSHSVLPSPTERSSLVYSFQTDRKRQTNRIFSNKHAPTRLDLVYQDLRSVRWKGAFGHRYAPVSSSIVRYHQKWYGKCTRNWLFAQFHSHGMLPYSSVPGTLGEK